MTNEEAKAWVDSRVWDNGCSLIPDETINAVEFVHQYEKNKALWDKLFHFLATTNPKSLIPGSKIVLEEGKLWVNVLEYTPKSAEETKVESHRNMIDLQYTYEGSELMGLTSEVITTEPYNAVKDVEKYRPDGSVSYVPATPDRFFLYFPSDMHQPSVRSCENPGVSHKLVGKIAFAK